MARHTFQLIVAATVLFLCSATPASAALIGIFSWQPDASGNHTFAIDVLADWPADLTLGDVFVEFEGNGSTGQAFLGAPGYLADNLVSLLSGDTQADCVGQTIAVDASSGSFQVQGFSPPQETGADPSSLCQGLQSIPQDIVTASLRFSFDTTLGIVTVDPLGPLSDALGPIAAAQPILFESAPAAVPEPSTLTLLTMALSGWGYRKARRGHRP